MNAKRCAIYARISTDKQSSDSPADQIVRCRDFASMRAAGVPLAGAFTAPTAFDVFAEVLAVVHGEPGRLPA